MDSLNNKRACTSYRIMVSVDQVKRYKEVIKQDCKGTEEYCEAKIALERAIPEWLRGKAWLIDCQRNKIYGADINCYRSRVA